MYLEKQFLIMVAKCVSAVFGSSKTPEAEPYYEKEELTPRRLDIVNSHAITDRPRSPAPKMGQMERSDAFTLPTPRNSTQLFVGAAVSSAAAELTRPSSHALLIRPCWESASSSASTLTSCTAGGQDTDPPSSAGSQAARDRLPATCRAASCCGDYDDEYIWDEMSERVGDLLRQEVNDSEHLERTVADAEQHCCTVGQIHDMAARIKRLMDENDRLTQNLLMENLKHSSETQGDCLEFD